MKKYIYQLFLLFIFFTPFQQSIAIDVYGSGFSYLGNLNHVNSAFPYTQKLNTIVEGMAIFDRELASKIHSKKFNFSYIADQLANLKNEDSLTFTLALQSEKTSIEKIGGLYKLLIELEGQLLFFDFNSMSIVASFPINIQYNDVTKSKPSELYIKEQYREIYFGDTKINFFTTAVKRLSKVNIKRRYKNYIQVLNSSISEKAFSYSPTKTTKEKERLSQYYAQSFSQLMSANQDISVLPYLKGHAIGNKLAGKYSSGEVYTLELPEPDYAVDINILAFKRKLFSQEKAGKSFIYAAQAEFNFYEPLSGKSYFNQKLFNGATKVIPSSQTEVDNWAAFNDSLKILFNKFTKQLNTPDKNWLKKHSGSTNGFKSFMKLKEVIAQCR